MSNKKFLILTGDIHSQSNAQIKEEFEALGHEAEILHPGRFVPVIAEASGFDRLYYRDPETNDTSRLLKKEYAGVVTRIGGSGFEYGMAILRHFETMGTFVTAPAFACENCSDKWRTAQLLSRAKIRLPKQVFTWNAENHEPILKLVADRYPIWGKKVRGSQGTGVFQMADAISGNQALQSFNENPLLIQRHINGHKKRDWSDIRCLVVGAETENPKLVAYERTSKSDDPRANFHIHKSGRPYKLSAEQEEHCITSAKVLGPGVVGMDFIVDEEPGSKSEGKTLFIEANQNLGLAGIQEITGINCAKIIAEYTIDQCDRKEPFRIFWDNAIGATNDLSSVKLANSINKFYDTPEAHAILKSLLDKGMTEREIINTMRLV